MLSFSIPDLPNSEFPKDVDGWGRREAKELPPLAGGSPAGVVETSLKKLRDLSGVEGESGSKGVLKLILNGIRVDQGGGKFVCMDSPVNNAAAAVVKQFKPKFFEAIQAATSNLGETRCSNCSAGSQCATDPEHRQMTASYRMHPLKFAIAVAVDEVLHDQNALGRESWRQLRSHVYYIT